MRQREQKAQAHKGRIPLEQIDIRELLDEINIQYTESGKNVSAGWIGVTCPFCDDSTNHMGINIERKSCTCFKCGTTGTIIKYLSEELGSTSKAVEILRNSVPRELRNFNVEEEINRVLKVNFPEGATKKYNKYHMKYLNKRGFSIRQMTKKYDLRFCGPGVKNWENRIIVPIKIRGRLVSYTSIDISTESNLRYKHLKDEDSVICIKHCLYGLDEARDNTTCAVVEGLFDKYRIGDGALCSFGTKLTIEQKKVLINNFNKVVVCFDGDIDGRRSAEKIANDVSAFIDVEVADLPDGLDPDKLPKSDIEFIRNIIGRN